MTLLESILIGLILFFMGTTAALTVTKIEVHNHIEQKMESATVNNNINGNVNMNNVSMVMTNADLLCVTNAAGGVYLYPNIASTVTNSVTNVWEAASRSNWTDVMFKFYFFSTNTN